MKTVLIVEDGVPWQTRWARLLADKVILLQAYRIRDARDLFADNPYIDLIALDACVPGAKPNTLELAAHFRQSFTGPMIAISSEPDYRKQLLDAGCNHDCPKDGLMSKIDLLLRL